jgi:hypothetical protein
MTFFQNFFVVLLTVVVTVFFILIFSQLTQLQDDVDHLQLNVKMLESVYTYQANLNHDLGIVEKRVDALCMRQPKICSEGKSLFSGGK